MEIIDLNKAIETGKHAKWEDLFIKGNTYKNFATLIVIATRGKQNIRVDCECPNCKTKFVKEQEVFAGLHPWVTESWKRFIKPMNVPIIDLVLSGHEVGEAYCLAIDQLLTNPTLKHFKYILFCEDDVIIPFIPDSFGPLIELYKHMDTYDVASGLYWTKGEPSLPLIYGDGNIDHPIPFQINTSWKQGDVVEVNGTGMGFTLMKRSIFEDSRLEKPFFKSVNEAQGYTVKGYTQDLYFYEKIKKLGYKICVDTNIKCGHLNVETEVIY